MKTGDKEIKDRYYYRIDLTIDEILSLRWLTEHGYWSQEAYNEMFLDPRKDHSWLIPESAARSITELAESDPGAFLSYCDEPLLGKLVELYNAIV